MEANLENRQGWLARAFSLDFRSLAILRIGVGLFTAVDTIHRLVDIKALYSDAGVLPRSAVVGEFANYWHWSLLLASDALWWNALGFGVLILAGLAMAAGYRTWMATFISWVMIVSIQNRNDLALDGCDAVHRVLIFWLLFLPLGAIWSVDALRKQRRCGEPVPGHDWTLSIGMAAFTLQMVFIFVFAALLKTGDPWRKDFSAAWYALSWDVWTNHFGIWVRQFHGLMRIFTIGTLVVEGLMPFLLFAPWAPVRVIALAVCISLHLGFVATMQLYMFASIMILGWIALMPGWLWEKLGVPLQPNSAWSARLAKISAWLPGDAAAPVPWSLLEQWPRAARAFAWVCLVYVSCWNVRGVAPGFGEVFPQKINAFGLVLRLDQYWAMFAPAPVAEDGWYVVPARLASGRVVDLYTNGGPVSWERPELISDHYYNRRWRVVLWTMTRADRREYRKYYAGYLCRQWASGHEEMLESFDAYLMHEISKPDYTVTPIDKMPLIENWRCH